MILRPRSALLSISIAILSAFVLVAAEKQFHPGPADSYAHQTSDDVVIGAQVYGKPEMVEEAFGKKIDFSKYGVTPVLVVIENKRKQSLDLRSIEVTIVADDGRHASAVKPEDIQLMGSNGQHPSQVPSPVHLPKRKPGIARTEIASRAFAAEMLAPGDTASGFFYFDATPEPTDRLYVSGLNEQPSGEEITYFEFPLQAGSAAH